MGRVTGRVLRKGLSRFVLGILVVFLVASVSGCTSDEMKYKRAAAMVNAGRYNDAIGAFTEIEQYRDSKSFILYARTLQLAESGEYALASSAFKNLGDFRDSKFLSAYYNARQTERNAVFVSAGGGHTVGLMADGTVMAVGFNIGECAVGSWADIVAVSAGRSHTVGLMADGTVVAVGDQIINYYGECDVSKWKDIEPFQRAVLTR